MCPKYSTYSPIHSNSHEKLLKQIHCAYVTIELNINYFLLVRDSFCFVNKLTVYGFISAHIEDDNNIKTFIHTVLERWTT